MGRRKIMIEKQSSNPNNCFSGKIKIHKLRVIWISQRNGSIPRSKIGERGGPQRASVPFHMQAILEILRVKMNGACVIMLNFVIDVYTCYAQQETDIGRLFSLVVLGVKSEKFIKTLKNTEKDRRVFAVCEVAPKAVHQDHAKSGFVFRYH